MVVTEINCHSIIYIVYSMNKKLCLKLDLIVELESINYNWVEVEISDQTPSWQQILFVSDLISSDSSKILPESLDKWVGYDFVINLLYVDDSWEWLNHV